MHKSNTSTFCRTIALVFSTLLLVACAVSPKSASNAKRSEAAWQTQMDKVTRATANNDAPKLWVVLAGLHDNSKAFEGDVLAMEQAVLRINPKALIFSMNNPHRGGKLQRPFGTRDNFRRALQTIGQKASAGDSVLVFITTHGHIDVLGNSAGGDDLPLIWGPELGHMLLPLQELNTGIIVSACHSGSLIPALRAPKRWVMTAAAAERSSFGCNFWGKQTFFVQALLQHVDAQQNDLVAWYKAAHSTVLTMEKDAKLSPSSNPQLWVGPQMQGLLQSHGLKGFFRP